MPVMPGYAYADRPHEKTVVVAGWKYGCHSDKAGDAPRGGMTKYIAHPWSSGGGRLVKTDWLPMRCGHPLRTTDPACSGCANRTDG